MTEKWRLTAVGQNSGEGLCWNVEATQSSCQELKVKHPEHFSSPERQSVERRWRRSTCRGSGVVVQELLSSCSVLSQLRRPWTGSSCLRSFLEVPSPPPRPVWRFLFVFLKIPLIHNSTAVCSDDCGIFFLFFQPSAASSEPNGLNFAFISVSCFYDFSTAIKMNVCPLHFAVILHNYFRNHRFLAGWI